MPCASSVAMGKKMPPSTPPRALPPVTDAVAIDCEMVQVAKGKLALAHVCAVGWDETVLLNERVDPGVPVVDYLTRYSGLRAGDLDGAASFASVQARVAALLDGRVLVGHSVANDLKALQLKHPAEQTRDTAGLDWGPRDKGLAKLSREVLGVDIQGATHSPAEDALASLRLLKHHQQHGAPPLRTVDVEVAFSSAAARPLDAPCAVVETAADGDAAADVAARWTLRLPWSRDARDALLRWFKAARQERGARALVFPASLSKEERGAVHREAQARSLPTESSGVDAERCIAVLAAPPAAGGVGGPPPRVRHLATIVYRWAEEAAMHAACDAAAAAPGAAPPPPKKLSLGELMELLGAGRALPPPHAALLARAEALLAAAGATVPAAYEAGVAAAERTRSDWQRRCLFA